MELVRQLWSLFERRQRRFAVVLFVMMVIGAGFEAVGIGLIMPFISLVSDPSAIEEMPPAADALDALGVSTGSGVVIAAGLALLVVYVVKNAYLALMYYIQFRFVFSNQVRLARRLFDAYLNNDYAFHLRRNSAQLLRNVTEEVRQTFSKVLLPMLTLGVELSVVVVITVLLVAVEPVVAPVAIVTFGILSAGFYKVVRRKTIELGNRQIHHNGLMIQWVNQGIGGVKEAKVAGVEDYFLRRFDRSSKHYADAMQFHRFVKEVPRNVIETLGLGGMILVVVLLVARGQDMTGVLPVLGLFGMAAVRMMPSLTRIIGAATAMRHFKPSVDAVYADLKRFEDRKMLPGSDDGEERSIPFRDRVQFHGVSYGYPGSEEVVLDEIDLEIRRGESVGFVGASGAGKTTCVDLLLGLLKPDEGEVIVDGRNIRDGLRSWQDRLGYIAQPVYLMDDTVRRNVAFGVDDDAIDDSQVWEALEDARLGSLVRSLPEQLDTTIGEGGVRISGGQRQRLGIARALYRRPELLVLDEATSSLDNATERQISEAIESLAGRMTLVIIAHRLSTVRHCDRLFFLRDGRIEAVGSYDELLAENRYFQQMVRAGRRAETAVGSGPGLRLK